MTSIALVSPFPLHALPRAWAWIEKYLGKKLDDFAPKNLDEFIEQWVCDQAAGERSWAVLRDGEIGGLVTSRKLSPCVADLHAVFKREFWGHKYTVPALGEIFEQIFGEGFKAGGVEKIESTVLPSNRPAVGMIAKFGGGREGLLLDHSIRDGEPIDVAIIGLRRKVFYENWRRIQLQLDQQRVREHGHDERLVGDVGDETPRPVSDGSGHLRGLAPIPDEPAGRRESGAHAGPQPGQ